MSEHAHSGRSSAELMDRVYRWQRYIYDATRKYYLLGRDGLIADLDAQPGMRVLEMGCGTGRNLAAVARRYPQARMHGFDISAAMLETAAASLARAGVAKRVALGRADATAFDAAMFGPGGFDRIYISYTLSMIPGWRAALDRAAAALAPGGQLHVVDFGRQERLPRWFRALLRSWLASFHVTPVDPLPDAVADIAARRGLTGECRSLYRGYTVRARLTRPA